MNRQLLETMQTILNLSSLKMSPNSLAIEIIKALGSIDIDPKIILTAKYGRMVKGEEDDEGGGKSDAGYDVVFIRWHEIKSQVQSKVGRLVHCFPVS